MLCPTLQCPQWCGCVEQGLCGVWTLTLQEEMTPSPPAHTMVFLTMKLHQSHLEHVA